MRLGGLKTECSSAEGQEVPVKPEPETGLQARSGTREDVS